jgi:hypothetical protein
MPTFTTSHRDLKCVLGGSKTLLATTFLHMLETMYDTYKEHLSDITFFEPVMEQYVDMLNQMCRKHNNINMTHDQIVGFVDGHLQVLLTSHEHQLVIVCTHHSPLHYGCVSPKMPNTHPFQAFNRSGGASCVHRNLFDRDVFSGKTRGYRMIASKKKHNYESEFLCIRARSHASTT